MSKVFLLAIPSMIICATVASICFMTWVADEFSGIVTAILFVVVFTLLFWFVYVLLNGWKS